LNDADGKALDNVLLFLTVEEAKELRHDLDDLLKKKPSTGHAHIPDADYKRELTICVYDANDLDGLDERSRKLIREP